MLDIDKILSLFYISYYSKSFRSLTHVYIELFLYAKTYGFLKEYGFKKGIYCPESVLVQNSINKYLTHNPIYDEYFVKDEYLNYDEFYEFKKQIGDDRIEEIRQVRHKCERFSASELYIVNYKELEDYVEQQSFTHDEKRTMLAIIDKFIYNHWYHGIIDSKKCEQIIKYMKLK